MMIESFGFFVFSPCGRVQIATCSFKTEADCETARAKAISLGFVIKPL